MHMKQIKKSNKPEKITDTEPMETENQPRDLFTNDWADSIDGTGRKPRKLSRIERRKKRVLIPALVLALTLSGSTLGVAWYMGTHSSEGNLITLKNAEEKQFADYEKYLNGLTKPEGWDDEAFANLKAAALEAYDKSELVKASEALEGNVEAAKELEGKTQPAAQTGIQRFENLFNNPGQYPASVVNLADDLGMVDFVVDYPQHANSTGADKDIGDVTQQMPDLKSYDAAWGYMPYGNSIMAVDGGAPTVIADVFSYCTDNPAITPFAVAKWAEENGWNVQPMQGGDNNIIVAAAYAYGIPFLVLDTYKTPITDQINYGYPVIIVTGTDENPKFYALDGVDAQGNWIAFDPTSSNSPVALNPNDTIGSVIHAYSFW